MRPGVILGNIVDLLKNTKKQQSAIDLFASLHKKLRADYYVFFRQIERTPRKGEDRKLIRETLHKIKEASNILVSFIDYEAITQDNLNALYSYIVDINSARDYFVDQFAKLAKAGEIYTPLEEITGMSPDVLNISPDVVKLGAAALQKGKAQRAKKSREGGFSQRFPKTTKKIREGVESVGAAFLGPFAPAILPTFDIINEIIAGRRASQEEQAATQAIEQPEQQQIKAAVTQAVEQPQIQAQPQQPIQPVQPVQPAAQKPAATAKGPSLIEKAAGFAASKFGRVFGLTAPAEETPQATMAEQQTTPPVETPVAAVPETAPINIVDELVKFFNKPAYEAKWTKELMRRLGGGKKPGASSLSDLENEQGKLAGAFKAFTGFLGGSGKELLAFGGVVAATAFTAKQLYTAFKTAAEWWEVHDNVKKEVARQEEKKKELDTKASDIYMKKAQTATVAGNIPAAREAVAQTKIVERERAMKDLENQGMWSTYKTGLKGIFSRKSPQANIVQQPAQTKSVPIMIDKGGKESAGMSTTKLENQLDTLNKNNKEMAKHIADMARRQSATQYGIGGNISVSDSEDPILRQINSGRFEIGD